MFKLSRIVWISIVLMIAGCAHQRPDLTLYEQLGGKPGLDAIVNNFIQEIGHDKQIFHYFKYSNVKRFKNKFTLYLCSVSDGPCSWHGDSMNQIHIGMHINERDFNHTVDLLIEAMNKQGVSQPVQNRLLARLAPLRAQIIYR